MIHRPLTRTLCLVALCSLSVWGADGTDSTPAAPGAGTPGGTDSSSTSSDPAPATPDDPATQALRKQASDIAAEGMQAMREADGDPHRGVDAAIDFSHALAIDKKLGDGDAICEMQADIYWCKKKMNLDNLQDYVAKKGAAAQADFSSAQAVMTTDVPVTEAQAYFDRAVKYRDANPDKHFEIAIRFSEISDRFGEGTKQGRDASAIFTHEQSLYLSQVNQERSAEHAQMEREMAAHASRFQETPAVASGELTPMPDKDALDAALDSVKKLYADDIDHATTLNRKRALAKKLVREAAQSKDDAAVYFEMIELSIKYASESEDYEVLLTDIELQGATFKDFDAAAAKKAALAKLQSRPVGGAIAKLLIDPKDKAANLLVGKYYCYNLKEWQEGVRMLALSSSPQLVKTANLEISGPKTSIEQKAMGDAWFAVGKTAPQSEKAGAWSRAETWYLSSEPALTGISKSMVEKNLDTIATVVPETITDWANITPAQFERLKGIEISVQARMDRTDTECVLGDGERVRIVASPTDLWHWNNGNNQDTTGTATAGVNDSYSYSETGSDHRVHTYSYSSNYMHQGIMTFCVGDGPHTALGIATGPGPLFVEPENPYSYFGTGEIRIKILKVGDDD